MRAFLFTFFLLFTFQFSFAQVDKIEKKKTITIKAKSTPIKKSNSLDLNNKNGFKDAYKNNQKARDKAKFEQELINKGILTKEMLAKKKLKENLEKNSLKVPMIDKDLGSFHTKSENINILCYDFGLIDGDVVSIYRNGELLISRYTLDRSYKIFKIPLKVGFNRIDIVADDEGIYRPNTGHFSVFDDSKETVISDFWQLAKGAKVTAMIIRDKKK